MILNFNKQRVIVGALLLSLIFILSAVGSFYLLRQNAIDDRSSQISSLTLVLTEHLNQTIYSANSALDNMIAEVKVADIKTEQEYIKFASSKERFLNLQKKTATNPLIDVATYVDAKGKIINFSRSHPAPQIDLSERDYFQFLSKTNTDAVFYSKPVHNKGNGKWVFYLAKRITGANEQFLGLALTGISVETFSQLYEKVGNNLGAGSAIALFKDDQTLLARWPHTEERIGKINKNVAFNKVIQNPELFGQVFITDAASETRDGASVKRLLSFRKSSQYPFIIAIAADEQLYASAWRKSALNIAYTLFLGLAVILIATLLLLRSIKLSSKHFHLANHDPLTQLPNRLLLTERLKLAISLAYRNKTKLAVIFIDLDNLKRINDIEGHATGDIAIKTAASRLLSSVRASDTVARIGGDEFVVALSHIDSTEGAQLVAEKIRTLIMEPLHVKGKTLITGASIGIAIYPEHGEDEATLSANADKAMYFAKFSGKNQVQLFEDNLEAKRP